MYVTDSGAPTDAVAVRLKFCPAVTICPAVGAVSVASNGGDMTVITLVAEMNCCGVGAELSVATAYQAKLPTGSAPSMFVNGAAAALPDNCPFV